MLARWLTEILGFGTADFVVSAFFLVAVDLLLLLLLLPS
jgi:hypothetical protein